MFTARRRPACPVLGPCASAFRVLPNDLDVFMHMNNGVYLTMADLGRMDLMLRSGLFAPIRARGWYPVMAQETIRFRRSLTLGQRYTIVTRILGWTDKSIYLEQRFERGEQLVAHALIDARFLSRHGGGVSVADVLALAGIAEPSPALPPHAADWIASQAALHAAA